MPRKERTDQSMFRLSAFYLLALSMLGIVMTKVLGLELQQAYNLLDAFIRIMTLQLILDKK